MTKKQRAQVVELLRCAADAGGMLAGTVAAWPDTLTDEQCGLIINAHHETFFAKSFDERDRVQACLEAAQRVEEGSWP
jgi:hypothetical protein